MLGACVAAYGALLAVFRLLNRPSDASVAAGLVVLFLLLFLVPVVLGTIWRKL
jgi:hypothetical protein